VFSAICIFTGHRFWLNVRISLDVVLLANGYAHVFMQLSVASGGFRGGVEPAPPPSPSFGRRTDAVTHGHVSEC